MQKTLHFEKNIALLLKVICFFQIIILIWFNIFQLKYHIGYDTSAYFDAAIEMWNQKSFLLKNYEYQTSLYLDSPVPLAAIFYGFTHNIFLSYGLSNLCCTCGVLILLKDITQKLNFKPWCQWLTLLLVLCPYLPLIYGNANSLEYFNVLYVDFAAYSVKLVFFLLFLRVAISFSIYEKIFPIQKWELFLLPLCAFIAGFSGGYLLLVLGIAPILVSIGLKYIFDEQISKKDLYQICFWCLLALILISGRIVSQNVLGFVSKDLTMAWIPLGELWDNFGSTFLGFISLLGALPIQENISILSKIGISYGVNFFIFICLAVGLFFVFKRKKKLPWKNICLCYLLIHVVIFSLADITYGQPVFETRYLIFSFFVIALLIGNWFSENDAVMFKRKIGVCLIAALVISIVNSDSIYFVTKNNYGELQTIATTLSNYDNEIVYIYGDTFETDSRNLRVIDRSKQYKFVFNNLNIHHWGDTLKGDDAGENLHGTIVLTTEDYYNQLPEYITACYEDMQQTIGRYKVFVSEKNPFDYKSGLPDRTLNYSIDYPYSSGVCLSDNHYYDEQGSCVLKNESGTDSFVLWGPYSEVYQGEYLIKLNYESAKNVSEIIGFFDIAINGVQQASKALKVNENSAVLEGIVLDGLDGQFEYRINLNDGETIKVKSIEMVRKE